MLRAHHAVVLPVAVVLAWALPHLFPVRVRSDRADAAPGLVMLRGADGERRGPVAAPNAWPGAVELRFDRAWSGRQIDLCVHPLERADGVGELQLRAPVRADGTLPIAGLAAGRLSVHAVAVEDGIVHIANAVAEVRAEAGAAPTAVPMQEARGAAPR